MSAPPLFVYGTLTVAGGHPLLRAAERLGPATTTGTLWELPEGYPALVPGPEGRVHGELVALPPPDVLDALDHYEGVAEGLYRRVLLEVSGPQGAVMAWAWVMDDPAARGGVRSVSGRWASIAGSAAPGDAR